MKLEIKREFYSKGSVLALLVVCLIVLAISGAGLLTISYGVRHQTARYKNEVAAMLAAEAGYESAVYRMTQQPDMLTAISEESEFDPTGSINFEDASCNYSISFDSFVEARPVFRVLSSGNSGMFTRTVDVKIVQAVTGWAMGMCRVPSGSSSTYQVSFADGEVIDMPIHINELDDSPDDRDIYLSGEPLFLRTVAMGEPRYTDGGGDKYASVMDIFENGIVFNQPDCKVTNEESVQRKIDRFEDATKSSFSFTPVAGAPVTNPLPAVHIEFFVHNDVGKFRLTNNCTVRGFHQDSDSKTWDFKVVPGSDGTEFQRYNIYAYHLMDETADATGERFISTVENTYVTQTYGGVESEPGGQIFVDGNVIIGSGEQPIAGIEQDVVKGKITIAAAGNIWIADSITVAGEHEADGLPSNDNPNVLGLIAQGVIKVVDPGMSDYSYVDDEPVEPSGYVYVPIGRLWPGQPAGSHIRRLPEVVEVEASITVGGGGWGAENVEKSGWWSSYGGRREFEGNDGDQDDLIVRGAITECVRGVVGLIGQDGFLKNYYLDERLLEGIIPGDISLSGKYVPAPAGWEDYRAN